MTMSAGVAHANTHAIDQPPVVLQTAEGLVEILPIDNGRFKVTLQPADRTMFVPRSSCETSLPPDVIRGFLSASFTWLCDTLARHDDPEYVNGTLRRQLLAYVDLSEVRGKRFLDFGCGSGASTLCMATMFPETEIVGVDLNASYIELARQVQGIRGLDNVRFSVSSDPNSLPAGIGSFDFVMMSAVYEHLLPEERRRVLPLIWSSMDYGGMLFINQTPHLWFPYEHHSTQLWFVNYLPDRVSLFLARNLSAINPALNRSQDWAVHLRGGIRGGTEAEICRNLRLAGTGSPTILQPKGRDRAGYWLASTNQRRYKALKKVIAGAFRVTDRLWRVVPSMNLDVAIRKDRESEGMGSSLQYP